MRRVVVEGKEKEEENKEVLQLVSEGIESIPSKSRERLGLGLAGKSRFLWSARVDSFAKINSKLSKYWLTTRGRSVLNACEILNVYMIRWCNSKIVISTPSHLVRRRIQSVPHNKPLQPLVIGAFPSLSMHGCTYDVVLAHINMQIQYCNHF